MKASKSDRFWMIFTILLVAIIAVSGTVVWLRYGPSQPVEISIPARQELEGRIYIDGAITNPGYYPFTTKDTIEALLQVAGGTTSSANLSGFRFYIPEIGEGEPQRININQAEVWLLKALPEIGETLAQRIVDYRRQNGPFHNTGELLKVAGIGTATYERIKDLITVTD